MSQDEVRGLHKAYVEDFLADLDATIEKGQKRMKSKYIIKIHSILLCFI